MEFSKKNGLPSFHGSDYGMRAWLWFLLAAFLAISLGIPIFGVGYRY